MLKRKLLSTSLLVGLVATNYAQAENKAEALELRAVDVVSATPLPALGTALENIPANVQTGHSQEMGRQQVLNLAEFLDNNLGSVNTSTALGNPYQMDVSYRGFMASSLLGTPVGMSVFVDGVRFNEPLGDVMNWDLLAPNAISSINLMPGSNPLFGLNTLGGALAVNTKSGSNYPGVAASLSGGSWGRREAKFEAGGEDKARGLDYFVAGNYFEEDGWRDFSDSKVRQLFSKLGWHNDKSDLDLSIALANNTMHGTQALPASMLHNPEKPYTYFDTIENKLAMISLKGSHFFSDNRLLAGNVYYRMSHATNFNSNAECDDDGCPTFTAGTPNDPAEVEASNVASKTYQDGYGGSLQFSWLDDVFQHRNSLTVGASVDASRVRFNQSTLQASLLGFQTVTDLPEVLQGTVALTTYSDYYGLYATDNFAVTDKLNVTVSGRYNLAQVRLNGQNNDLLAGTTNPLDGNHQFTRLNPAIGFNYNPSRGLGVYGGYSESMRAPTPIELSCADPALPCALPTGFNADPPLNAVIAKTWEGGMRGRLWDNLSWNVALYNTLVSDDIQFIAANAAGSLGYFQNVGKTQRRGLEMGVQGKWDKLSFGANYGFVDATYESEFMVTSPANSLRNANNQTQVSKGNQLPGIPRQTLKMRLSYDILPNWYVGANVVVVDSRYAFGDENNQDVNGKIAGYAVVHLDSQYQLDKNWSVFAKVNNLFDKDYATYGLLGQNIYNGTNEQFRTPAAPLAAWLGVSYRFGGATARAAVDND